MRWLTSSLYEPNSFSTWTAMMGPPCVNWQNTYGFISTIPPKCMAGHFYPHSCMHACVCVHAHVNCLIKVKAVALYKSTLFQGVLSVLQLCDFLKPWTPEEGQSGQNTGNRQLWPVSLFSLLSGLYTFLWTWSQRAIGCPPTDNNVAVYCVTASCPYRQDIQLTTSNAETSTRIIYLNL